MTWKKINSEPVMPARFYKWSMEPGESVEGVLQHTKQGRFGFFSELETDSGLLNVPLPGYSGAEGKKVAEIVSELAPGTLIKLVYAGPVPGRRGRPRNHFDLYVAEA